VEVSTIWGMIDARHIVFPAQAPCLNALTLMFTTPTERVVPLLAGDAYEVIEISPGSVDVLLAMQEYVQGDWGPCNTTDLCIPVRPVGATAEDELDGLYLPEALINRRFNGEVAYWSMGIARRPATIEIARDGDDVIFTASEGERPTVTVRFPFAEPDAPPTVYEQRAYSYIDGEPYVVPFDIDFPQPVYDGTCVEVDVGTGRLADTLRSLGLPREADAYAWGTGMACTFHCPRPLSP
jgi:hypothetical protein